MDFDKLPIRIDIGRDGENIVIDIWAQEEVSEDRSAGTWKLHEHLSIAPPRIMEKVSPGELDPRD